MLTPTIVTLGITDLKKSRNFYEKVFAWKASNVSQGDIVFFQTPGIVIALYPHDHLAKDATVSPKGEGFSGITLAHNVLKKEDVAMILKKAETSGGKILKPAQDVFWGGHSGYFSDLDGHLWEIAWNPYFKINKQGLLELDSL